MFLVEPITLTEIVARSLHSNHLETLPFESAIDRIGALGRGNQLGINLFHFREGGIPRALRPAFNIFFHALCRRFEIPHERHHREREFYILRNLAFQALEEWLVPQCPRCQGTGIEQAKIFAGENYAARICTLCRGAQVYRHSDYERARSLGIPLPRYYRVTRNGQSWAQMLELALAILREREGEAKRVMTRQLREENDERA